MVMTMENRRRTVIIGRLRFLVLPRPEIYRDGSCAKSVLSQSGGRCAAARSEL